MRNLYNFLRNVINKNYWNIGLCKPLNVEIGAKTGTSNFDENFKKKMNYPDKASKDIWISGFSKDYSIAIWTGFDKYLKNEKTYFLNGENNKLAKKIFKRLMEEVAKKLGNIKLLCKRRKRQFEMYMGKNDSLVLNKLKE